MLTSCMHYNYVTFVCVLQEFILYMMNHPMEKNQQGNKKIDIKPHAPFGSKKVGHVSRLLTLTFTFSPTCKAPYLTCESSCKTTAYFTEPL